MQDENTMRRSVSLLKRVIASLYHFARYRTFLETSGKRHSND